MPPTSADDGFTLTELVVAVALAGVLIASAAIIMNQSAATTLRAQLRDEAAAAGFALLEHAEANGCGLVTGNDADRVDAIGVNDGYSARLGRIAERCFGSLGGAENLVHDPENPTGWYVPASCGTGRFTCSFNADFDFPREAPAPRCEGAPAQPSVLVRTATISWEEAGGTQRRVFATREAVSADSAAFQDFGTGDSTLGSIQVNVEGGTAVSLVLNNDGVGERRQVITRVAAGEPSVDSCVYFPFLAQGSWTLERPGTSGAVVEGFANVGGGGSAPTIVDL